MTPHVEDILISRYNKYTNTQNSDKNKTPKPQGEKQFKCKVCNKEFAIYQGLYFHREKHIATKAYPCTVCNRRFGQAANLNRHMKNHFLIHKTAKILNGKYDEEWYFK